MDWKEFAEVNRAAWNQVGPIHERSKAGRFFKAFEQPGYSCLDEIITPQLRAIGIEGKRVAQLCCNDGRELLSLLNLGASEGVGFDISDAAISEAERLAERAKIKCRFLRTDALDIPFEFDGGFDLVYISIGALGWMPDIDRFMAIPARLLRHGGHLVIYEQHPFLEMMNPDPEADPLRIISTYFKTGPELDTESFDYWGDVKYEALPKYWFGRSLAQIFTAILSQGFRIIAFHEYSHDIANGWAHLEKSGVRMPLSYTLIARKSP